MEITEEFKERETVQIINNQTQSLDKWIDYLASPDAQYSDWAKYWTFRSILEVDKLVKSLDGYPLEWCTANPDTAQTQLQGGDFYVYYSINESGEAIIPRLAIRLENEHIAEVRGIAPDQNLDPYIAPTLEEKLEKFGAEGEAYKKKSADMKLLTEIENKVKAKQPLAKDELVFLDEINSPIEGFGYQKDPRIEEIRQTRNAKEDAPIVFECRPEQIAWQPEDVDENTKAYIGEWNIEIFQKIKNYPNISDFYESFPDKKILIQTLETDRNVNSPALAEEAIQRKNMYLADWGEDILYKTEFSKEAQKYELVRFNVRQLGFPDGATTDEIYKKAENLGLELCPAEVGPHLRLQNFSKNWIWLLIAMKQIADRNGHPYVFNLSAHGVQLGLNGYYAKPSFRWRSDDEFVFRFQKPARQP